MNFYWLTFLNNIFPITFKNLEFSLKSENFDLKSEYFDLKSEYFNLKSEDFDLKRDNLSKYIWPGKWNPNLIYIRIIWLQLINRTEWFVYEPAILDKGKKL